MPFSIVMLSTSDNIFMPYFNLVFLWVLFYGLHSFLANLDFKHWLSTKLGKAYKGYRLVYSLFSTVFFLLIMIYGAGIEKKYLLASTDFTTYLGYMLAAFGTIIMVKAFKNFSIATFSGLRLHNDLEEQQEFIKNGIHAYVRHPIYSGLLLIFLGFFFFDPVMSSLIHLGCLVVYLPVGIYFEEKKLIRIFGDTYIEYKKEVPSLFPRKFKV